MSQDLNDYVNGKVQKAVSDTMKAMSKREEPFMNFIRGSDEIDTSAIFDAVAIDFEGHFKNLFIEEKPKFNPILKEPILPLIPLTKEPKF